MNPMRMATCILVVILIQFGCSPSETEQGQGNTLPAQAEATFVNRVWKVAESNGVQTGQLYVFLADGTLIITSTRSTPTLGKWSYDGKALTMVEEGLSYKVDILELSKAEFRIRSNNPGGFVDIELVPAE